MEVAKAQIWAVDPQEKKSPNARCITKVNFGVMIPYSFVSSFYVEDGGNTFSEVLVAAYKTARHRNTQDHNLISHLCEHFILYSIFS
jgi:hypothetical protein